MILFFAFRIMVGLAFAMIGLGLWSLFERIRGGIYDQAWLHRAAMVMGPAGFVAILAGWTTTEVGRQPYTVYGLLTTAHSASPIAAQGVGASLIAFVLVYFAVFGAGVFYILRLMAMRPTMADQELPHVPSHAAGVTPGPALAAQGG